LHTQPTHRKARIELLDVYRGFAIFGIFVVNIVIMNSTFLNQDEFALQWTAPIDKATEDILKLFFYTKFFPIFSLLFGLGISMQALKMAEKQQLSTSFFVRRMFILFLIGIAHILFLWSGDVLHLYAIIGLFTTLMLKRSNKLILGLAILILLFPFYNQIIGYIFEWINFKPESYLSDHTGETVNQIIKSGTYLEGMQLRTLEYVANIPMLFGFLAPVAIAMFLIGLYLGKNKIYNSLDSFIQHIKKPILFMTLVTNIYRVLFLYVIVKQDIFKIAEYRELFIKIMVLSDTFMGLFYIWFIGWLWYNTPWKKFLRPLRYAGRMALTNYIMHSFIGLILFSCVGFGLYETLSPVETFSIATLVFIVQIILSKLWLHYFKYGPLEWVWRCCTYKKVLRIKKSTASGV
jgi:uncharacterized protein